MKKLFPILLAFLVGCGGGKCLTGNFVENRTIKLTIDNKEHEFIIYCATQIKNDDGLYFIDNRYVVNLPPEYYLYHDGLVSPTHNSHYYFAKVSETFPIKKYEKFSIYYHGKELTKFELPMW